MADDLTRCGWPGRRRSRWGLCLLALKYDLSLCATSRYPRRRRPSLPWRWNPFIIQSPVFEKTLISLEAPTNEVTEQQSSLS